MCNGSVLLFPDYPADGERQNENNYRINNMNLNSSVFSGVGQDIHRLESNKADKHEIHTLNSNVDSLERANRELRAEVNGLRSELQTLTDEINRIKEHLVL